VLVDINGVDELSGVSADNGQVAIGAVTREYAAAEDLLAGERPSAELFDEAARRATRDLDPPADLHGSSDYRKTVAAAVVRRGLRAAATPGPRRRRRGPRSDRRGPGRRRTLRPAGAHTG
jgi:CO/xanthine dehydrogenase FAD-binding subunit